MDEGGKQLGSVVIAVVVAIALIALAVAVFSEDGAIGDALEGQISALETAASSAVAGS